MPPTAWQNDQGLLCATVQITAKIYFLPYILYLHQTLKYHFKKIMKPTQFLALCFLNLKKERKTIFKTTAFALELNITRSGTQFQESGTHMMLPTRSMASSK